VHFDLGEGMARKELLLMLLGVTIVVTLCVIIWNNWFGISHVMMRRQVNRLLVLGIAATLFWMYKLCENRG